MPIISVQAKFIALCSILAVSSSLSAQEPPPSTIRTPELRRDAIVGVQIIPSPGERIDDGVILLSDGVIEAVGSKSELDVPPGYRVHERNGMVVYPGLIEPALLVTSADQATSIAAENGAYPNTNVVPQLDVSTFEAPLATDGSALRGQGFCTALLLPSERIFRGRGQVVLLDEDASNIRSPGGVRPQSIGLDTTRGGWRSGSYPGSSMGVAALVRQVLSDADWHARSLKVWADHPEGNEPPTDAYALEALGASIQQGQPFIIDSTTEIRALRGARIAREFDLEAMILGSGTEFRRTEEIAATGYPILVPLSFPKKPEASGAHSTEGITLRTLLTWKHAPENPRRLMEAGSDIALTTHRLEDRSSFRANLAKAIEAGLSKDDALEALTRTPARLLEVDEVLGTIEPGRIANIVVVDGDLFEPKDPIREVWIAGRRHSIKEKQEFAFPGKGTLQAGEVTREATVDRDKKTFQLQPIEAPDNALAEADAPEEQQEKPAEAERKRPTPPERKSWRARSVNFSDHGVSGVIDGEAFDLEGPVRFDAVLIAGELHGVGQTAKGNSIRFLVAPTEKEESETETEKEEVQVETAPEQLAALPRPLGAYGRHAPPEEDSVLFRNARIWTSSDPPILENAELYISNGHIVGIGYDLQVPEGTRIEDVSGKHITAGLIDCHSHTGIDGSVNEFGQNNSAEVRIGDVLDPDDINWYRQLAGGLTTANQLHGSANPIGGQNAVVKLRWGVDTDEMHMEGAKPGIKFALGENVVRPENRYPDTRMGVAAFIEDNFRAASEYDAEHERWSELSPEEQAHAMPPRRDLELETLAEILASDRIIHCHSYRQDEILMLLRTAERWGFTIGTLQHVLEGYKVAEAIAEHGAGASSFSDWWAYKMEVMDAIPYNGALMTKVGVLTSFNSDSDEVARRMNAEAAKAVRYGGLAPHEALNLVTINPAKQLRIDNQTGSLEPGKDADFVVWSGDPLSTYTRCEQTWIDGKKYFDIQEDVRLTDESQAQRAQLLASLAEPEKKEEAEGAPDVPAGRRFGPPGGWRGRRGPPTDQGLRQSTLARMLEAREDYLFEIVRSGFDPEEIRPGACGCGTVDQALAGMNAEAE